MTEGLETGEKAMEQARGNPGRRTPRTRAGLDVRPGDVSLGTPGESSPAGLPAAYTAYSYAYPHKSAYGPLEPPVRLRDAWEGENTASLFLYVHLPFCEMRCGFCNLFTQSQPPDAMVETYLATLERQSRVVRGELPPARCARLAWGGGTPTYLQPGQLERLIALLRDDWGATAWGTPTSVETSPATATEDRLRLLRGWGVRRISLGVQSFAEHEAHRMGRPQRTSEVLEAIGRIRRLGFPVLNLDLIYGESGQTVASWLRSIEQGLQFRPEEFFLYPLYVRPQTGLARVGERPADDRLVLYRAGRDRLREAGYRQVSMRCFRREGAAEEPGPAYCCQEDAMLGLGCGARSYTRALHYSAPFAVSQGGVRAIVAAWSRQADEAFAWATYGIRLDTLEQQRRRLILSLLQAEGVDRAGFRGWCGVDPCEAFPQLRELIDSGLALADGERLRLTEEGLEQSDAIGPWLYSSDAALALARFEPA